MTNKTCKPRSLTIAVAALLLATGVGIARAQILPETSGNLWFYSPSHYPPSRSVPVLPSTPAVVPTAHRHVHHANGDVRC